MLWIHFGKIICHAVLNASVWISYLKITVIWDAPLYMFTNHSLPDLKTNIMCKCVSLHYHIMHWLPCKYDFVGYLFMKLTGIWWQHAWHSDFFTMFPLVLMLSTIVIHWHFCNCMLHIKILLLYKGHHNNGQVSKLMYWNLNQTQKETTQHCYHDTPGLRSGNITFHI